MKLVAALLFSGLALAGSGGIRKSMIPALVLPSAAPEFSQNWYGRPVLPELFGGSEDQEPPEGLLAEPPAKPASRTLPPLLRQEDAEESKYPSLMTVLDVKAWRDQEDLRRIRETAGNLFLGVPMIIPQVILEELLPRGLAVGPNTFLYPNSPASTSLAFIVFDQALFHEAQFLERVQAAGADDPAYAETLTRGQRHVLRRSLMTGFRVSYSLPAMSLGLILQTSDDMGVAGYMIAPAAAGTLIFLKGLDQKFEIADFMKARVQLASGRQWVRAAHVGDGLPVFSCELKFFDFPIALIANIEALDHGLAPAFIGIGTSLDVVEDLLGREENRNQRLGR
ncbi:MAG TPA: hypothetical protein VE981_05525 [Planctomycetota bacterium]|nr:hypothetical protein [Planctomycetota bacterium]